MPEMTPERRQTRDIHLQWVLDHEDNVDFNLERDSKPHYRTDSDYSEVATIRRTPQHSRHHEYHKQEGVIMKYWLTEGEPPHPVRKQGDAMAEVFDDEGTWNPSTTRDAQIKMTGDLVPCTEAEALAAAEVILAAK